jgi:hypothetical protein
MSQYDQDSKPPRAGDTVKMEINGFVLILTPMPYGKLKHVMKMFFSNLEKITKVDGANAIPFIIEMFDDNLDELIDLAFNKEKNPFLTREWYENNITLPHMKQIVETLVTINDVNKSFFGQRGTVTAPSNPPQAPQVQQPELNLAETKAN